MGRMGKGRLEAFSDGVIAIIITIMVLEMKVPHGAYLDSRISMALYAAIAALWFIPDRRFEKPSGGL
jgi:uncharacterized membrane protein